MANKNIPSASVLNEIFPHEAYVMERTLIINQLRLLGIEYKVTRNKNRYEVIIEIPTTGDGMLRITAADKTSGLHRRFFRTTPPQQMRLPGGKVLKSEAKETVHAEVEFISNGPHEDVTYILKEPNFAEVIDTAIESLAQIENISVSPLQKKRPQRRENPNQPELGDE